MEYDIWSNDLSLLVYALESSFCINRSSIADVGRVDGSGKSSSVGNIRSDDDESVVRALTIVPCDPPLLCCRRGFELPLQLSSPIGFNCPRPVASPADPERGGFFSDPLTGQNINPSGSKIIYLSTNSTSTCRNIKFWKTFLTYLAIGFLGLPPRL